MPKEKISDNDEKELLSGILSGTNLRNLLALVNSLQPWVVKETSRKRLGRPGPMGKGISKHEHGHVAIGSEAIKTLYTLLYCKQMVG